MNPRTKLSIILGLAVLAAGGCQPSQRSGPDVVIREQTVTIDELASRLGLRIVERQDAFVILKNMANTVLIFTHDSGRFFVNGKPIGSVGAVKKVGRTVYVPDNLVAAIQACLRAAGSERPGVAIRPRPRGSAAVVVIDAGHGGKDPGTMVGGAYEKSINLQVARKVAGLLSQQGLTVVMTRDTDEFIELEERADIANRRDADLFVSIHADSAPDRTISGYTLYVAGDASREAYQAAQAVSAAMSHTGSHTRGIREADYKVLVQTKCPAILIELGYLSNFADARRLQDNAFQNRLAQAITSGILDYLR